MSTLPCFGLFFSLPLNIISALRICKKLSQMFFLKSHPAFRFLQLSICICLDKDWKCQKTHKIVEIRPVLRRILFYVNIIYENNFKYLMSYCELSKLVSLETPFIRHVVKIYIWRIKMHLGQLIFSCKISKRKCGILTA